MAVSSKHYEIHLHRKFYLYLSVLYCTEARARSTNCKEGFESLGSILVIMNTNTEIIVLPCGHQEVSPNYLTKTAIHYVSNKILHVQNKE